MLFGNIALSKVLGRSERKDERSVYQIEQPYDFVCVSSLGNGEGNMLARVTSMGLPIATLQACKQANKGHDGQPNSTARWIHPWV